jgi:hypothetical protein
MFELDCPFMPHEEEPNDMHRERVEGRGRRRRGGGGGGGGGTEG